MGGVVTTNTSNIVTVDDDGTLRLTWSFRLRTQDHMPVPVALPDPTVSPESEGLINTNWQAICHGTSAFDGIQHGTPAKFFYHTFYQTLFATSPHLRPLFRSSMTTQSKSFAGTLHALVTILTAGDFVETAQGIAERRVAYGVAQEHYTDLALCLERLSKRVRAVPLRDDAHHFKPRSSPDSRESPRNHHAVGRNISTMAKRLTFPLGLPMTEAGIVRRHFVLASFADDRPGVFCICVEARQRVVVLALTSTARHNRQAVLGRVGVRFETDTPRCSCPTSS
ncbi:Aste57867_16622 [Aphanomyces stellatus]|uniref:Aste57867_16622 protein n=1 Tax=Aphanomyces stellatus TaxID=120398 RepID=A0A485L7T1_9STRA|nr:hypothetical protein As57867_016565 [Aphanomyces stellatus]VFT93393.1 Aste57867_16622 [Aphanomyces stellatus]